jgi:hypothetical protein
MPAIPAIQRQKLEDSESKANWAIQQNPVSKNIFL